MFTKKKDVPEFPMYPVVRVQKLANVGPDKRSGKFYTVEDWVLTKDSKLAFQIVAVSRPNVNGYLKSLPRSILSHVQYVKRA